MQVTGKEVRAAALAAGITKVDHHDCSLCGVMVHYSIQDGQLFFNSQCGCTRGYSPPEPRSWDSAADWINMQIHDDHRKRIMAAFGLTPAEST